MRVAIDCRTILNPGYGEGAGVGHYVYFLVKNILAIDRKNQYVLFFDERLSRDATRAYIGDASNAKAVFFPFHKYKEFLPVAYSHFLVAARMTGERPQIVHIPAGAMPLSLRLPTVLTVHDLAIYSHPQWFPKQNFSVKVAYPRTIKSARRIIAVSRETKKELVRRFGVSPAKISVVHPGVDVGGSGLFAEDVMNEDDAVDWVDLVRRYKLRKPYLLFLGTLEPRKNVVALAEAFTRVWRESPLVREMEFLVAGAPGYGAEPTLSALKRAATDTRGAVRRLGYVAHRDKFPLVRSARAFVFPSLAEGFGMPVVEALALGVPTVVSDIPVFREVAGEAALYANPNDSRALAKAIIRAVADSKVHKRLAAAGPRRAKRYSWEKAARETVEVYRKTGSRK